MTLAVVIEYTALAIDPSPRPILLPSVGRPMDRFELVASNRSKPNAIYARLGRR
jgi:hypothetical protein